MSFQELKELVAPTAIAAMALALLVFTTFDGRRRTGASGKSDRLAILSLFLVGILCGSPLLSRSKGTGGIHFPTTDVETHYLYDNGSYVTNDYVHVAFSVHPVVPNSADLIIERRVYGSTNDADWVEHLSTTIGAFNQPQDIQYQNATNFDWIVYTTWTPGSSVETNGVWHAYWGLDGKAHTRLIPVRTAVWLGSEVIATPQSVFNATNETNEVNQ